jgi:catechol 2,3-dioxygenase-like lactoylglutathione lyase family enzyme
MKLSVADYVVIIVEDLDRALAFYTRVLGLALGHRSGPFAQLATGATRICLYRRDAMQATLGYRIGPARDDSPGFELGFKVADVDAAYAELVEQGAVSATPPADRHWGQRTAYIKDPDGHLIELAQDLSGAGRGVRGMAVTSAACRDAD